MKYINYILLIAILISCNSENKNNHKNKESDTIIKKTVKLSIDTFLVFDTYYDFLKNNQTDSLKSLINKYGIDLKDFKGRSFYNLCLNYSNSKCIHHLLDAGYKAKEEEIYETIRKIDNDTILANKLIISNGRINYDKIFTQAIYNCDIQLLQYLIQREIKPKSITYIDMDGEEHEESTFCFIKNCKNSIQILNLLLSNGLSISPKEYQCLLSNSIEDGIPSFATNDFLLELIN